MNPLAHRCHHPAARLITVITPDGARKVCLTCAVALLGEGQRHVDITLFVAPAAAQAR